MENWAPISFHLLLGLALIAAVTGAVWTKTEAIILSLACFLLAGVIFLSDRRRKAERKKATRDLIEKNVNLFKNAIEAKLDGADREIIVYATFLYSLIDNDDPEMRDYILEILSTMPRKDFNSAADEWRKWHRYHKAGGGRIKLTKKVAGFNIKDRKEGRS